MLPSISSLLTLSGLRRAFVGIVPRTFERGDVAVVVEDALEGRRERHIDDLAALGRQLESGFLQQRLGVGLGVVPDRCAAEADTWRRDVAIDRNGRQRHDHGAEQGDVVERARHQSQRVGRR